MSAAEPIARPKPQPGPANTAGRWLSAVKPASWPKILVPALLGQALGIAASMRVSAQGVAFGLGFTVFDLIFVVLMNDWGDREVDAIKRRLFPDGCSPKTIPDGIIPARSVARVGLSFGVMAVLSSIAGAFALGSPILFGLGLGGVFLFVAYTLPPLRLNYRGGGELLEMLGVGVLLPLYNAHAQAPERWSDWSGRLFEVWPTMLGFAALSLASAIASGLSDETSDRAGGKKTFATTFGNRASRRLVEVLVPTGAVLWLVAPLVTGATVTTTMPAAVIVGLHYLRMLRASGAAGTDAFAAHGVYKQHLHRAIWYGASVHAVLLAAQALS